MTTLAANPVSEVPAPTWFLRRVCMFCRDEIGRVACAREQHGRASHTICPECEPVGRHYYDLARRLTRCDREALVELQMIELPLIPEPDHRRALNRIARARWQQLHNPVTP